MRREHVACTGVEQECTWNCGGKASCNQTDVEECGKIILKWIFKD
jgi:hypothetical protein